MDERQFAVKANIVLKRNIEELLHRRGESQRTLAAYCRRDESWLSHILRNPNRGLPLKYLDRIASFFGVDPYQLFLPGISPLFERRHQARRSGQERRIGHAKRAMLGLGDTIEAVRAAPGGKAQPHAAAASPFAEELRKLSARHEREISALISRAESGGKTPRTRAAEPKARKGRGDAGGSDARPPAKG